ncbi:MAG: glucosidase [Phycisphaeraceae bacterium]
MAHRRVANAERRRQSEDLKKRKKWKRWGPYLAERQWGTVREDYSPDGSVWHYFPFEHAHMRAYRWGEDGLMGFCDRFGRMCFGVSLWNGRDPILKERLFGLTGPEGNHGEDVKEDYFYVDATPTHSYSKAIYKYPQAEFPYEKLREENAKRGLKDREYELVDTGVFDESRYFDLSIEYAKADDQDILIRLTIANRGPEAADLHVLPTLWFRNTWSWGVRYPEEQAELSLRVADGHVITDHERLGEFHFFADNGPDGNAPDLLVTENETNFEKLFDIGSATPYTKDAFHRYVIDGEKKAVNPKQRGTKAAAHYKMSIPAGEEVTLRLRLSSVDQLRKQPFGSAFDRIVQKRINEADAFYEDLLPQAMADEHRQICRQSYAGLLWTKQFYQYVVHDWLRGDEEQPNPPQSRIEGRNSDWEHLYNRDVISMPDKWEYPWYAAWDLAFHMIPMARLDPAFAKEQLVLFLREWYMHPNGQIPAYEFAFSDVNPPVHAWACWRVYKIAGRKGKRDLFFLARTFQKLLINFTWWVNRKDVHGEHLFSGGFLGLDNIGVFDRSAPMPGGGKLHQADATAWMAFYCGTMLSMSLELAVHDRAYSDTASKFFEHFVAIADAMNQIGGAGLWDETDGFYYDRILTDSHSTPLKIRSLVGLIPLIAVEVLPDHQLDNLPGFQKRMDWFLANRKDLAKHIAYMEDDHRPGGYHLLGIPNREKLVRVLRYMLDEKEFLSPFGLRSLSRYHLDHPFELELDGQKHRVGYVPGESETEMFGGNSNWRGPVWFPINFLIIEALERWHHFYGDSLTVECPTGSGNHMNLKEVARELAHRLASLFERDKDGRRPCHGDDDRFTDDPHFRNLMYFNEYFHGDTGRGLGASHQTGWTALVARCLEDYMTKLK